MNRHGATTDPAAALLEAWNAVLDDFEAALDRAISVAEGGNPSDLDPTLVFTPPTTMPPMPVTLAARAQALLERNTATMDRVTEAAGAIRPNQTALRPQFAQRSSTASSLDLRA